MQKLSESEETFEEKAVVNPSLVLKMDAKSIENCMNIITLQIQVAEFLANCETEKPLVHLIPNVNPYAEDEGLK